MPGSCCFLPLQGSKRVACQAPPSQPGMELARFRRPPHAHPCDQGMRSCVTAALAVLPPPLPVQLSQLEEALGHQHGAGEEAIEQHPEHQYH